MVGYVLGIDTALINTGVVVLDCSTGAFIWAGKPFPKKDHREKDDSFFNEYDTIKRTTDWIWKYILDYSRYSPLFVAMEDYLLTSYARSYKTAELNSAVKDRMHSNRVPYCLVHPLKTKKYVVKQKTVTKTEIIDYVKTHQPETFKGIDKADYSDIADAWAIAKIGQLVYQAMSQPDPHAFLKTPAIEPRWREILVGDTGIIDKPGLVKWSYT